MSFLPSVLRRIPFDAVPPDIALVFDGGDRRATAAVMGVGCGQGEER